jgi:hypothetical protein
VFGSAVAASEAGLLVMAGPHPALRIKSNMINRIVRLIGSPQKNNSTIY